jgi:hypothetical protein
MDMEKISLKVRVAVLEKAMKYVVDNGNIEHRDNLVLVAKKALKQSEEIKDSDIEKG